jgi:hypothetical protein
LIIISVTSRSLMESASTSRPVFNNPFRKLLLPVTANPSLTYNQDFTQAWGKNGWFCSICTPPDAAHKKGMTVRAAMRHERTIEHIRNVSEHIWHPKPDSSAWENTSLTSETLKVQDKQSRVDNVRHMVPWWVRAVEAAERGEEMRMEDFLDTIQEDPWANIDDVWECPDKINGTEWANTPLWGDATSVHRQAVDDDSASSLQPCRTLSAPSIPKGYRKIRVKWKKRLKLSEEQDIMHSSCASIHDPHNFVEEIARREAADAERKRQMHIFFDVRTVIDHFLPLLIIVPLCRCRLMKRCRRFKRSYIILLVCLDYIRL